MLQPGPCNLLEGVQLPLLPISRCLTAFDEDAPALQVGTSRGQADSHQLLTELVCE